MQTTEQLNVPHHSDEIRVAFPAEHVLLLTMNRPKSLNAMTPTMEADIDRVLTWYEGEPSLWYVPYTLYPFHTVSHTFSFRVAVITGEGRGFCAGADLKAYVLCPHRYLSHVNTTSFTAGISAHSRTSRQKLRFCAPRTTALASGRFRVGSLGASR